MSCTVDVISIGTLSHNPFWNERTPVRTSHATTTLIRDGQSTILVDPSLPAESLTLRLHERAGLRPDQVTTVFLTCFPPVHRRSLDLFDDAEWLIHPEERSTLLGHLNRCLESAAGRPDDTLSQEEIEQELVLLGRTRPAPERLGEVVHTFPSPGVTPGTCALLVAGRQTTIIAGDAVLTRDHYQNARIHDRCFDIARACQSFAEIVEVAELIIPGHDNLFMTV